MPGQEVEIWISRVHWMMSDSTTGPFQIMMLPYYMGMEVET